jgi:hypothetical protein
MWTWTISPSTLGLLTTTSIEYVLLPILAAFEIMRRSIWNLFRLENEQLNNVGKFRAIDVHVPIMPDA